MSNAEYVSGPLPVLAKLAAMLRNNPAMQLVFAGFASLLRKRTAHATPVVNGFVGEVAATGNSANQLIAIFDSSNDFATAAPTADDPPEREPLIRRRWMETGIKMWNPHLHGAGLATLNIQGRSELLSAQPGEGLPRYDKLEFNLIEGCIICEGVMVDPPQRSLRVAIHR
jgi:hypothetical protein